jgi:hypothetical protein
VVVLKFVAFLVSSMATNSKTETTPETSGCQCPFDPEIPAMVDIRMERISGSGR